MLRNTVNSEALMTAFHLNQTGTNGTKVPSRAERYECDEGIIRSEKE